MRGMNRWTRLLTLVVSLPILLLQAAGNPELKEQVRATERAFAKTMADRDAAAFATFLSRDAVFMSGSQALRGSAEVAKAWQKYFSGPAPFSWEPETVEVVGSGNLAMSSGPVRDPSGKRTGTFNSVWRLEAGGKWKIVLDNGCPACDCARQ
jgi:ketosteroid isomerase-like protein